MSDKSKFSREVHFWESPEIVEALERIAADNARSMSAEIRGAIRTTIAGSEHRARLEDDELQDRLVSMARASLRAKGIDPDDRGSEVDRLLATLRELER